MTELFGPVLGVMHCDQLDEAIELVHQTGYGLTSGLESLDDREQQLWATRLQAGNLYINRPTTGAIVLRQPFGGMGKSAFGPGIKAGGPNYVVPLMNFGLLANSVSGCSNESNESGSLERPPNIVPNDETLAAFWEMLYSDHPASELVCRRLGPAGLKKLAEAVEDYDRFATEEIRQSHDTLKLVGQDNIRRYRSITHMRIRLHESDSWLNVLCRALAVRACGGRAVISQPPHVHVVLVDALEELTHALAGDLEFIEESDSELVEAIASGQVDRVRYSSPEHVPVQVRKAATDQFIYIADASVTTIGRVELLWYVREQSLCIDYHRYGNLGFRADEARKSVL